MKIYLWVTEHNAINHHQQGFFMKYQHLHFMYVPGKEQVTSRFAQKLIKAFGQTPIEEADAIITVGGDGLVLQALRQAGDKPVYGITAEGSASRGFWTDHDVNTPEKLIENLEKAEVVLLAPLKAEITFANGKKTIRHAFNEVAAGNASGQAIKMDVVAKFSETASEHVAITGDGLIFSTALGSTGTSRAYNGPAVDIHNDVITLAGKGIYEPKGMATAVFEGSHTVFEAHFKDAVSKRPVRIDFDGLYVLKDESGSPITALTVSSAHDKAAKLLVTKSPGLRAFTSMVPTL
jgi:NAD+ kinase